MATLQAHAWPGNVRELKNAVERSLFRWADPDTQVAEVVIDPFRSPYSELPPQAAAEPDTGLPEIAETAQDVDFNTYMAEVERRYLADGLARNGHHQGRTAKALGLSYDQLRGLVRKHGLSRRRRR